MPCSAEAFQQTGSGGRNRRCQCLSYRNRESYAFDLSAGLGEIRLNGQSKGAFDAEYETGSNGGAEVELTAGVGDILF